MHSYPSAPFQCPHCGGAFQILPELIGQAVACPHCNGGVLIPETTSTAAPPIQASAPPAAAEPPQSVDPWQPPAMHPPMPAPGLAPPLGRTSDLPVSEPPVVTRPEQAPVPIEPPPTTTQPDASLAPNPPAAMIEDSSNSARRQFVIPTLDGGQTTIQEPVKTVTVGRRQRQLRDMNSDEKATWRSIKNLIVASLCTAILAILMWWLLS